MRQNRRPESEDFTLRQKLGVKRYVRTEPAVDERASKGAPQCGCGYRKRGAHHDDGAHHAGRRTG